MKFHFIRNMASHEVSDTEEPLRFRGDTSGVRDKKGGIHKWLANGSVSHVLISAYEGRNANKRVNIRRGNPPEKMHGLIADFDSQAPASAGDEVKNKLPAEHLPAWIIETRSGACRLVWEFEQPLPVSRVGFLPCFLDAVREALVLDSLLDGFDAPTMANPVVYYEVGRAWERVSSDPLSMRSLAEVAVPAFKAMPADRKSRLPENLINAGLREKFPLVWKNGSRFADGMESEVFWETPAVPCVLRREGAYRLSADGVIVPWRDILGRDITEAWEKDRIGRAIADIHYAGRSGYYRMFPNGAWVNQGVSEVALYLSGVHGFSRKKNNDGASEVDAAVLRIQQERHIDGAVPVVFNKDRVVEMGAKRFLNIARTRPMSEATPAGDAAVPWADGFPWIAEWLWGFFSSRRQLVYFLCWLRWFYLSAESGTPNRGHAVFVVGGVDRGKTLMNAVWIPMMLGGGADAGSFLVQGGTFNRHLLECGHWHIDDSIAAIDEKKHTVFTERVKQIIANPLIPYQPKYVDEQMVPWNGRIMVTLNADPKSLRLIPDLSRGIRDKMMIFRCSEGRSFKFPDRSKTLKTLETETPRFLRWLRRWKPPAFLMDNNPRFGLRPYLDPATVRQIERLKRTQRKRLEEEESESQTP